MFFYGFDLRSGSQLVLLVHISSHTDVDNSLSQACCCMFAELHSDSSTWGNCSEISSCVAISACHYLSDTFICCVFLSYAHFCFYSGCQPALSFGPIFPQLELPYSYAEAQLCRRCITSGLTVN